MSIRVFDSRITIGKHRPMNSVVKSPKIPGRLIYPFGYHTTISFNGQRFKLVDESNMVIDCEIGFQGKKDFSILTIDGGFPLYKFPTPDHVTREYMKYDFVYHGIEFMLEIRLESECEDAVERAERLRANRNVATPSEYDASSFRASEHCCGNPETCTYWQ